MSIKLVNFKEVDYYIQLETRNWRNSEQVSRYFQLQNISEQTHKNWLEKLKHDPPDTIAFLIQYDNKFIGVTYFHSIDRIKRECNWGMYIYDTKIRGIGLGGKTLEMCLDYAKGQMGMDTIYLEVLNDNLRAISLYEKFGFEIICEKDNVKRYKKII